MPNQTFIALQRNEAGGIKYVLSTEGLKELELLAELGCPKAEIAAHFEVSSTWLEGYLEDNEEVRLKYDAALAKHKQVIRRNQKSLSADNAQMAIWLGKQVLGQRDKHEFTFNHKHRVVGTLPDLKASGESWLEKFAPPQALQATDAPKASAMPALPVPVNAKPPEKVERPKPNAQVVDVTFTEISVPTGAVIKDGGV